MELKDQIKVNAPRADVFAALNDVDILRQAIPGCEEIEANGPDSFTATVSQKVGPLKAKFKGDVTLADIVAPESYTLQGSGKAGPAGHVKVRAAVRLDEDGDGTLLSYDVNADIGGKLAQLGGHLVERTSKKLSAQFFERVEELIGEQEASAPKPEEAPSPESSGNRKGLLWVAAALVAAAALWLFL